MNLSLEKKYIVQMPWHIIELIFQWNVLSDLSLHVYLDLGNLMPRVHYNLPPPLRRFRLTPPSPPKNIFACTWFFQRVIHHPQGTYIRTPLFIWTSDWAGRYVHTGRAPLPSQLKRRTWRRHRRSLCWSPSREFLCVRFYRHPLLNPGNPPPPFISTFMDLFSSRVLSLLRASSRFINV